jgi:SNF2 family DNA or RNA helicase
MCIQVAIMIETMYNRAVQSIRTDLIEPYQPQGVQWMLQRETESLSLFEESMPNGGILADEVGLGKTILSISVILGNPKPKTLVILPKSLVSQWESQLKKFAPSLTVHVVGLSDKNRVIEAPGVYLISQSLLNCRNRTVGTSIVHNVQWDRVFIDEAHLLRNSKSKIFEACCMLNADIKWALTATPVMNRMTDFVNIMRWVGVSQFLCQGEKEIVTANFILRRTKEDVKTHNQNLKMAQLKVQVKYVPFNSYEEADFYAKVYTKERNKIKTTQNNNTTQLLEHLLRVRQLCIHPQLYLDGISKKKGVSFGNWEHGSTKITALIDSIQAQPKEDKTLIFCQFVKEMDIYEEMLNKYGYQCARLDGNMSIHERECMVQKFNKIPEITVFIIQINTGGQGINLQTANRIYIMSPNWNPAIEYQAIGRAHRTGQTKNVYVTKFCITSGDHKLPFIEENIIKLQERKKQIVANILNDQRIVLDGVLHEKTSFGSGLSAKDIRNLFNIHGYIECDK